MGQNSAALESFDRALRINPNDVDALTNNGVALMNLGHYDEAMQKHKAALKIQPDHPDALDNIELLLETMALSRRRRP
ncbi:MAG: tetratricopeptide repeat protein [Gammaproteobacteria bacterium]|nr:tetratricopeptide repeat protein [Gammaproteobacteria bacterium]